MTKYVQFLEKEKGKKRLILHIKWVGILAFAFNLARLMSAAHTPGGSNRSLPFPHAQPTRFSQTIAWYSPWI